MRISPFEDFLIPILKVNGSLWDYMSRSEVVHASTEKRLIKMQFYKPWGRWSSG
jgi:hypothetical protein